MAENGRDEIAECVWRAERLGMTISEYVEYLEALVEEKSALLRNVEESYLHALKYSGALHAEAAAWNVEGNRSHDLHY